MNSVGKAILIAFAAIFLANLIWLGWKTKQKYTGINKSEFPEGTEIISKEVSGDTPTFQPDVSILPSVIGNEYTLHFVFDIKDYNTREVIVLAQKGSDYDFNPKIKIDTVKGDLEVLFTLQNEGYNEFNNLFNNDDESNCVTQATELTSEPEKTTLTEAAGNTTTTDVIPVSNNNEVLPTPKDGFNNISGISHLYNKSLFKNISNETFYDATSVTPTSATPGTTPTSATGTTPESVTPTSTTSEGEELHEHNETSENHIKHNHEHIHDNEHTHNNNSNDDSDKIILDSCKYSNGEPERPLGHNRLHHFTISVYNNIVDIYKEGELTSSCTLNGIPNVNNDMFNFLLNGEIKGSIYRFIYFNKAVNQDRASSIYNHYKP